jgi:dihydrodipicolinate synthase/N-acetylneuraminate lyase
VSAQGVDGSPSGLQFGVDDLKGIMAFPPTPALPGAEGIRARDTLDLAETERMICSLMEAGVDGIVTNGTLGEMATLTLDEWKTFVATVGETVHSVDRDFPIFVGATAMNTRETVERIDHVRSVGLRGVLLGRPMWSPMGFDTMTAFYQDVAAEFPDVSFILYDNPEVFKGPIPPPIYARLAQVPNIIGAKAQAFSPKFRADVTASAGKLRILPIEIDWLATRTLFPDDQLACWSPSVMMGPEPLVFLRDALDAGDTDAARWVTDRMEWTYEAHPGRSNFAEFSKYNVPMEKLRYDAAGFVSAGPARAPYHVFPDSYREGAQENAQRWRQVVAEVQERAGSQAAGRNAVTA